MKRSMINELKNENVKVKISGWVHRVRKMKNIAFVIVKDRTGLVQCVLSRKMYDENMLNLESVISLEGLTVEGANKYGKIEVHAENIIIHNRSIGELPIQVNKENLDVNLHTQLENRVLSLRHDKEQAVFKIQSAIAQYFSEFLRNRDFTEIHTPKLVKEGAEGGANVFELDYFGQKAFLAQSPQFYKQMMVIAGLERVFEIGPVFRAEHHNSNRHLNEYVSMDMEVGFIESEIELMMIETELLKYTMENLNSKNSHELKILGATLPEVPDNIPVLSFSEVKDILTIKYGIESEEGDLNPEGERMIAEFVFEEFKSEFLFISHYPRKKRPMYTMPEGEMTKGFDLIFRGLEITTGGLRIHNYDMLVESMELKGLQSKNYSTYLEAFKYGAPPHGGFAIGLERLCSQLLGFENVRRTSLFPRDVDRLTP